MAWYLAPSLEVLRSEVNARWPNRDRTSDGTIGDAGHAARVSDHNPNGRGSVNAWDMDKDGVEPWVVIAAFERHPSAHYWIYQRTIADRDTGWRRRSYTGDNPHTLHVHFSIRQSSTAEQDRRPWGVEDNDMARGDDVWHLLHDGRRPEGLPQTAGGGTPIAWIVREVTAIRAAQAQAAAADEARANATLAGLNALAEVVKAGGGNTDTEAILAEVRAAGDRATATVAELQARLEAAEQERELLRQQLDDARGLGQG